MKAIELEGVLIKFKWEPKSEWIVEQLTQGGKTRVIGKIIFTDNTMRETLHLNNINLEDIWDLCNYGPAQSLQKMIVDEIGSCPYANMHCYTSQDESIIYIPISHVDTINSDIFIRKHYEPTIGYWIKSFRHGNLKDEWVYGDKQQFIEFYKNSPFLWH